jgi:uncharacterized membrane protein YvlD (DUF360 family)
MNRLRAALAHVRTQLRRLFAFYGLQVQLLWTWRAGRVALIRRGVISFVVAFLGVAAAALFVPGIEVDSPLAIVLAVVVIGLLNAMVRPVLLAVVEPISLAAVGVLTLLFQFAAFLLLGPLVPGLVVTDVGAAFLGSWVFAIVHTLLSFFLSLDPNESYFALISRQLALRWSDAMTSDRPGVVIVQIDGLSHSVLTHQLRAGRIPNMARWIRDGRMRLVPWNVMLPSQTSASQAGILHGNNDDIPAFRWWEKTTQRLLVSNHPRDALEIQRRVSNGEGLLSADGASIGNLLTGDAARSYVTMASLSDPRQGLGQTRAYAVFFVSPHSYLHSIVLGGFETMKEIVQAYRQRRAAMEPRMHRGLPYPLMRAATNVLLRQLNSSLVIEEMYRGTPVIYVDFTDYDEIAHHSGPERSETLDSLDGIDRVLGLLEKAAADAPRPYRFVVLSDHGQSLGATFLQRYGHSLESVVRAAMGGASSVVAATGQAEEGSQLRALGFDLARARGVIGGIVRSIASLRPRNEHSAEEVTVDGETRRAITDTPEVVVCASGNLGLVYFPMLPGRQTLESLQTAYPRLVDSLVAHPGIGVVLIRSAEHGAIALGHAGRHYLDDDRVEGEDPLRSYGELAGASLRRLDTMQNCADVAVISMYDESTGEVAAFEELIGSHGGLGGDQTRAFMLFPAEWPLEGELTGAPQIYRQLRRWLGDLGIELGARPADSTAAVGPTAEVAAPVDAEGAVAVESTEAPESETAAVESTVARSASSGPRST